jgi:CheY-like chemotaxis protein
MGALLGRTLGEHMEIALAPSPDLGLALVDPVQLESALLNLCVNARDAMPTGGRLTIETANVALDEAYAAQHPDVQPGPYVLLAVADTGLGISPEHLAHVFEPFFTTKPIGEGTGLGLAMVYGFVKQSGGHVAITSAPGQGTTVRLYLPRTDDAHASSWTSNGRTDALVGGSETILLVEDEASVRQYASTQLASLGYRVLAAGDGPEALSILRQHADVALLLTDIVLPGGLSGPRLAEQALALRPGLKVLYSSGYTANEILHHGRVDAGALLLPKPYRRADLARKVRAALA